MAEFAKVTTLFADNDGVIVGHSDHPAIDRKTVHPTDVDAARRLHDAGVKVVHTTSRPLSMMKRIIGQTGTTDAVLDAGSTIIIGGEERHDLRRWLERDETRIVAGALLPIATHIGYNGQKSLQVMPGMLRLRPPEDSPSVFAVFPAGEELRGHVLSWLANTSISGLGVKFNAYNEPDLDCVRVSLSNKADGVERYQRAMGVSVAQSAGIGDGEPDVGILQRVAHGYAIGDSWLARHVAEARRQNPGSYPGVVAVGSMALHGFSDAADLILKHNGPAA